MDASRSRNSPTKGIDRTVLVNVFGRETVTVEELIFRIASFAPALLSRRNFTWISGDPMKDCIVPPEVDVSGASGVMLEYLALCDGKTDARAGSVFPRLLRAVHSRSWAAAKIHYALLPKAKRPIYFQLWIDVHDVLEPPSRDFVRTFSRCLKNLADESELSDRLLRVLAHRDRSLSTRLKNLLLSDAASAMRRENASLTVKTAALMSVFDRLAASISVDLSTPTGLFNENSETEPRKTRRGHSDARISNNSAIQTLMQMIKEVPDFLEKGKSEIKSSIDAKLIAAATNGQKIGAFQGMNRRQYKFANADGHIDELTSTKFNVKFETALLELGRLRTPPPKFLQDFARGRDLIAQLKI